jgi:glutathione synthase/RimK-type ligase-like ATP-grasp enzyme
VHIWTPEEQKLALAATEVVGARFAGIDLLYDPQGRCYVIEANGVPGWRGFARTTGIDVAQAVITSLEEN